MRLVYLSLLLLFLLSGPAAAAPAVPRPYAGIGLAIIRPGLPQENTLPERLVLYREPGVGRAADKAAAEIPLLTRIIPTGPGEFPVAVLAKKGTWLKVAYDDGGRSGWLEMQRRWDYVAWEDFLPGKRFSLLPGLRKEFYRVVAGPVPSAAEVAMGAPRQEQRMEKLQRDWLASPLPDGSFGWLRWRDESGRFLIALPADGTEKNR